MKRLHFLLAVLAGCAAAVGPASAQAQPQAQPQPFPSRAITLVVPNPPGGVVDTSARLLADALGPALRSTVIVDNRAGASGSIAYAHVARAPADGHTLLASYSAYHLAPPRSTSRVGWSPRDLTPVALVSTASQLVVVHPSVPANTLAGLVAHLQRHPDHVRFASQGQGSMAHVSAQLLQVRTGTRMTHVPYRGSGPAVQDLLDGHVQLMITSPPAVLPHVRAGRLKALAVTSRRRHAALPDVPTAAEAGLPNFELETWVGIFAPADTPPAALRTLGEGISQALAQPQAQERARAAGIELHNAPAAQFAARLERETPYWTDLLREAGLAIQ